MNAPTPAEGLGKVGRNAASLFTAEVANVATGIILVVVLARLLNASALGLFSLAYSIGSVMGILCLFGGNIFVMREVARDPSRLRGLLGASILARIAVALALLLVLQGVFLALGYSGERTAVLTALILVRMGDCWILMLSAFFRGLQDTRTERTVRLSLNAITLLLGLPLLVWTRSLLPFALLQASLTAVALAVVYRRLSARAGGSPMAAADWRGAVAFARAGLPFSIFTTLLILYVQTNTILLGFIRGDEAVGLYTSGFRFVSALGMAATSLTDALFPAIARLDSRADAEVLRAACLRVCRYLLIFSVGAGTFLFAFAPFLMRVVYGPSFGPAVLSLRIMAFTVPLAYLNTAFASFLFSRDDEKGSVRRMTILMGFVLALNFLLLPKWGHLGAAVTTLVPEMVALLLNGVAARRLLPLGGIGKLMARFALLAGALALLRLVPRDLLWEGIPAVRGLLFTVIFFGGLAVLGLVEKDEVRALLQKFSGGKKGLAHA